LHEVRLGRIKAAIWENETQNGARHNVTLQRIYRDEQGTWNTSDSFGRDDLPLVAKVDDLARTWMFQPGQGPECVLPDGRIIVGGKPLQLRLEGEAGILLDAPESALAVALGNLIGNAVKYTQTGDVVVRVFPDAVEVVDSGPGLSAEDAAKLFERGYRGTHAGHSQGGGIGLSIVRRLCALYGWDVRVRPGETRGVIATLSFTPGDGRFVASQA